MIDESSAAAVLAVRLGDDPVRLTADGKLVDFLDSGKARPNKPEEWVRQTFARKLHYEYGYPKERMAFEAPISIGASTKYADIAVYRTVEDAAMRNQAGIAIIVETKAPTLQVGQSQLASYIFATSADGGMWVNDNDAPQYFRRRTGARRRLDVWPNIPRAGLSWDDVGRHRKSALKPPHNLVETFRRCHNALYKVGIDSADLAMDMVRIILAKYQDETNEGDVCEFRCSALEAQSKRGRKQVAQRVRGLFKQVRDSDPDVFDGNEEIEAGDKQIVTVVSELQGFRFVPEDDSDMSFDVVGAAYEVYVGSHLKGDRGQYFTPRFVVQLLVKMLDPTEKDVVLDPAMGSGGFLIASMRHVIRRIRRSRRSETAKNHAVQKARRRLFGIDKSPKLVKIAKLNMILASDGHAGLVHGDTLEPPARLPSTFVKAAGPGRPTAILTNPPFGATSEHRITFDRHEEILSQFDISKVWGGDAAGRLNPTTSYVSGGVPPEYLFLERCLRWLAPGGKLGVVIPRGILSNIEAKTIRLMLLREARILAVMNCHDDTFKPHTNAKASIILCERKKHPSDHDDDYPIFMAVSQGVGHTPLGQPIYKRDVKGEIILVNGHPVIDEDTDDIFDAWQRYQRGEKLSTDNYFRTTRSALSEDLILNPTLYLPKLLGARTRALELGQRDGWKACRLAEIAAVYNGPRFKRPYADEGVTSGPGILRYFTGNAVTQTRGENVRYLDLAKAKSVQRRMIKELLLERGMILITDSGTVGRVVYATSYLEGAVGTNNLIRVVVKDEALRGLVYTFLQSEMGQAQIKRNLYGAIVHHVEPAHLHDLIVPVPTDREVLEAIGLPVIAAAQAREQAQEQEALSADRFQASVAGDLPTRHQRLAAMFAAWDEDPLSEDESGALRDVLTELRGKDAP